jgi:hypothetical protein
LRLCGVLFICLFVDLCSDAIETDLRATPFLALIAAGQKQSGERITETEALTY